MIGSLSSPAELPESARHRSDRQYFIHLTIFELSPLKDQKLKTVLIGPFNDPSQEETLQFIYSLHNSLVILT